MEAARETRGLDSGTRSPEHGEPAGEASPEPVTVTVLAREAPDTYVQHWIRQVHGERASIVTDRMAFRQALNSPDGLTNTVIAQMRLGPVYVSQKTPALQMGELRAASCANGAVCYGVYFEINDANNRLQEVELVGLWQTHGHLTVRVLAGSYGTGGRLIGNPRF